MTDFLLELLSEEIPARMQVKAKDDLARLFTAELAKSGLAATEIETFTTPRRLALIARGLPLATEAVSEETKGPKVGAPPQAMEGFLRKTGVSQEQLVERDGVYFAVVDKPGRQTADVLGEAIPAIIRAFPWPKSQRWGAASLSTESLRWVRPLQGIVALLGEDVVPCEIDGIVSGRATMGHRFHSSGPVSITSAATWADELRAAHVLVHFSERCRIIRDGAAAAASAAGLSVIEDEGLVVENAGLTEWPVPLLGRFDEAYLSVPPEVIQLTARVNQKYFVCKKPSPLQEGGLGGGTVGQAQLSQTTPTPNPSPEGEGNLANAFVCTANIDAHDGGAAIIAGNEKVLAARLSDAKFFWEQDLKVPLAEQAAKLSSIVFHEKLGTVADKVERVAKLARWLCEEGVVSTSIRHAELGSASTDGPWTLKQVQGDEDGARAMLADLAERAARLCKADLVTGMVGEFPELQGVMGGYYARAQGEVDAVADAIRDHYKPVGQGDDVPTAPVTVAVSLADKLDTLLSFFAIDLRPTGSKDPFALRRATLAVIALVTENQLRFAMAGLIARQLSRFRLEALASLDVSDVPAVWDFEDRNYEIVRIGEFERLTYGGTPLVEWRKVQIPGWDRLEFITGLKGVEAAVWDFLADRLKVQQREAGVRHDLIDAVFALGGEDDLVRLLARVKALQAFMATDDGANLLAGYKRAANLLKQAEHGQPTNSRHAELGSASTDRPWTLKQVQGDERLGAADTALLTALDAAEPLAAAAVAEERFEDAMRALASLRGPIDAFFDGVMVNDPDAAVRTFRLGLLARFRDACHAVADFSKIEG